MSEEQDPKTAPLEIRAKRLQECLDKNHLVLIAAPKMIRRDDGTWSIVCDVQLAEKQP